MYKDVPVRRSIRLRGFDYSSNNLYFVTLCVQDRKPILSKVVGDRAFLSPYGRLADQLWANLPDKFEAIALDEYVIMPNHIHGIIIINAGREDRAPTLGQIIAYYKYQSTKQYNLSVGAGSSRPLMLAGSSRPFPKIWQRNYYEHIIRDEDDLNRIRKYIRNNPINWTKDKLFP